MIELEKTYLLKKIPKRIASCEFREIIDIYFPGTAEHPTLRLRKNGNKYEITKKEPINKDDASRQKEQTITITEAEFNELAKVDNKKLCKLRYYYNHNGKIAYIDVFQDSLRGLILVDFEFKTLEEKNSFKMPDFCLADVTQEEFLAGGMLCGKLYKDIESKLRKFGYKKLFFR